VLSRSFNAPLHAGGQFINVTGIPDADHIASYDGSWHALGTGVAIDSFVRSLTARGTDVYVGTDSVNVAGIANADHAARWDGPYIKIHHDGLVAASFGLHGLGGAQGIKARWFAGGC